MKRTLQKNWDIPFLFLIAAVLLIINAARGW